MRRAFLAIPQRAGRSRADGGLPLVAGAVPRAAADVPPSVLAFATVSITYHWNEYLWPLMMLNDPRDKQVLTIGAGLPSAAMGAESGGQWGHHRRRDADGLPAADAGVHPFPRNSSCEASASPGIK